MRARNRPRPSRRLSISAFAPRSGAYRRPRLPNWRALKRKPPPRQRYKPRSATPMRIRLPRTRPIGSSSGKIQRTDRRFAEKRHGADEGSPSRQGRHQPQGCRANDAGVTIGTGEGGNAFGDRFFIRGFDARNDVFVDGIRDPAVNIRENFFTEQVEILKGPSADDQRPRHRRRRDQHRHQAGNDRGQLLQRRLEIRERQHQALHVRRQPGHQPDARCPRRWHVAERRYLGARLYDRRSLGRIGGREVVADQLDKYYGQLHPHQSERTAGLRRSLQHRGPRAGDFGRCSARYLLRVRESRLSAGDAGYRNADRPVPDQRPSVVDQRIPGRAIGAQLHRDDSRAGNR